MQSDYISRQDAIDGKMSIQRANGVEIYTDEAVPVAHLKNVPAADVAPVVHGKWIPHSEKSREYIGTVLIHVMYDYWLCDTCGYRVENGQPTYNFCPKCGAKMDGGKS